MNRPRLIRNLRIAWSAWWGMLCVLLIVLWVRSHSVIEGIAHFSRGPFGSTHTLIGINNGTFQVTNATNLFAPGKEPFPEGWSYKTTTWDAATKDFFNLARFPEGFLLQFPILLPAICIAIV